MCLLESPCRGNSNKYTKHMFFFLKNKMGISMKKYMIRRFFPDGIDVITNFAVITNVVIKRVLLALFALTTNTAKIQTGAVVEWLEQLGYGAESRRIA